MVVGGGQFPTFQLHSVNSGWEKPACSPGATWFAQTKRDGPGILAIAVKQRQVHCHC